MSPEIVNIRDVLLRHADQVKGDYEAPWLKQKPLSMKNANKFFLGAILDYQIKADIAWDNARRLSENVLGDPSRLWDHIINSYTREEWASKWRVFRVHRFPAAHDRIWRIGNDIVTRYDGDVRKIWEGKNPDAALRVLERMRCGPEISRMIIGCLITNRLINGRGDVKADTHICTVLGRIFNRSLEPLEARQLARTINPDNPWELDIALYDIGKYYCLSDGRDCYKCPVGRENQCEDFYEYKKGGIDKER